MVATRDPESLREAALKYLWMHSRDWVKMAEEGDPVIMVEGKGVEVTDSAGKTWIDTNGGCVSVNVGYGRTEIADAAFDQMLKITFNPHLTSTAPVIKLAQKLADITPGTLSRVYPVSGGSEANETALKIARSYHKRRGEPGRYKVISRKGSFHGSTAGVLWLGEDPRSSRSDYEPPPPGMLYAPQPNPYHCEMGGQTASECAVRCAQGAVVPGDEYWPMLRQICDRYGVLLIADEVINGFGRTGKMFAVDHWDVVPDIMTVAKGIISSYLPLAATIATEEVAEQFGGEGNQLNHVITFGGHPVPAAAALKNIEILENEHMVDNSAEVGGYFKEQLEGLKGDHSIVGDVRGAGLLLALELVSDQETRARFPAEAKLSSHLNESFKKHSLILRMSTGVDVISLGPPLCITRGEVDKIVHALDLSLWELEGTLGIASTT